MLSRTLSVTTFLALAAAGAHAQDAAAGGMAFQQCAECHSPTAADNAGPGLKGVFGRRAASATGRPSGRMLLTQLRSLSTQPVVGAQVR